MLLSELYIDHRNFLDKLESTHFHNVDIFVSGDFNIDLPKPSRRRSDFFKLMKQFNMDPKIKEPTRILGDSATCIANIFSSCSVSTCQFSIVGLKK